MSDSEKRSDAFYAAGMYERAATAAADAVAEEPDNGGAWLSLANAHAALGNWTRVEAAAREVIRYYHRPGHGWNQLGRALTEQARVDESLDASAEAVRLEPLIWQVHANRARAHLNAFLLEKRPGALTAAKDSADEALRLAPQEPGALQLSGEIAVLHHDVAGAGDLYREAVRAAPGDAGRLAEYASFTFRHGDRREGLELLASAFLMAPETPGFRRRLARLFLAPLRWLCKGVAILWLPVVALALLGLESPGWRSGATAVAVLATLLLIGGMSTWYAYLPRTARKVARVDLRPILLPWQPLHLACVPMVALLPTGYAPLAAIAGLASGYAVFQRSGRHA